ncbi:dTMP kinase [Patescibacteria group bacterium]|nr:dTMP kinase [Patescibacteria group bacterium]
MRPKGLFFLENRYARISKMIQNTHQGKFIVFDSLDGSGQSTQISLLRDFLIGKGFNVLVTKEPTKDSDPGKKIREALDRKVKLDPLELQKLFTEDRRIHLDNLIIPALKQGTWVITDRYFLSTFAYGVSEGLDLDLLIKMNDGFLYPDQGFILKVRPEVCIDRIEKRGTTKTLFERKAKLAEVWKTYEILPQRVPNFSIMDGERAILEVFEDVKQAINKLITH